MRDTELAPLKRQRGSPRLQKNKLAPAGITIRELIDEYCGGMAEGHGGALQSKRRNDAVMGDPVNAARIQDLTKEKNVDLLIDANTAQGLDGADVLRLSGDYILRGKKGSVRVYEVDGVSQPVR